MNITNFIINNFIDAVYCVGYRTCQQNFWNEKISHFEVLKPGLRYWYADPIPCSINGNDYVFVEKYDRFKQIGYIGVSKMQKGRLQKPRTIIKGKTHMSFPLVISYKGEYYMFPESSETKSIEVFKMVNGPYQWEHYYSFKIDEKVVDIAIREKNDSLLMLVGIVDENPLYTKRQIIQVKNLERRDKITFNVGYTDKVASLKVRNGGNFQGDYRVVQESTEKDYGMYLILNKVNEFDEEKIIETFYSRKTVSDIDADLSKLRYRKIGIHTYGRNCNNLEVIDVAATQLSIHPFIRKRKNK